MYQKINLYVDFITSYTDKHTHTLKMDHKPKCKCKTANLLESNKGENIDNVWYRNDSLDTVPKAESMKEVIIKPDFIKVKKIFSVKDIVKRVMRQATDWEKMFAKCISEIYKNS